MRCILFDLDGTLVLTGGAGLKAFDRAFRDVFAADGSITVVSPAGRTDPYLLRKVCEHFLNRSLEPDEERTFFERYLVHLQEAVDGSEGYRVLPGVRALLDALCSDPRCRVGLGTGNIKEGARVKLERADLWRYFSFGGFGSDAEDRVEMLRQAVRRGRALLDGARSFSEVIVVGDTPLDIEAGRALGARTAGVATGPFDEARLRESGADWVYADLSDLARVLSDWNLA